MRRKHEVHGAVPGDAAWSQLLVEGAASMSLTLDPWQIGAFSRYALELIAWSRRFNLTAVTAAEDIAVRHFLDSMAGADLIGERHRVLDVGTGAGFPGLPLKLLLPSLPMTLIDAARKKTSFVSHVIRSLNLKGVEALQARCEQLADEPGHHRGYDVVVSRALSALTPLVRLALPLVKQEGRIVAWKSGRAEPEITDLEDFAAALRAIGGPSLQIGRKAYSLPGIEAARQLVIVSVSRQ